VPPRRSLQPRKRPVQQRSRLTVDQILEAAGRVFAERGYAGATTNHIAQRAGVSIGSLYQYFPNKDTILVALHLRHMESASEVLRKMMQEALRQGKTPEHLLRRFVRRVIELHASEPELHHVLLYEGPRPPELSEKVHAIEDDMARAVEQMLSDRGGIARSHAKHAAYLLVHVVENMAHEYVIHPPPDMPVEVFVEELVTMLSASIWGPCAAGVTGELRGRD
jgi:AcrR family transcriptional regulator